MGVIKRPQDSKIDPDSANLLLPKPLALATDRKSRRLLRCDGFGRLAEVLGELAHAVPIGLLRALADRQQLEVIGVGV